MEMTARAWVRITISGAVESWHFCISGDCGLIISVILLMTCLGFLFDLLRWVFFVCEMHVCQASLTIGYSCLAQCKSTHTVCLETTVEVFRENVSGNNYSMRHFDTNQVLEDNPVGVALLAFPTRCLLAAHSQTHSVLILLMGDGQLATNKAASNERVPCAWTKANVIAFFLIQ